MSEISIRLKFDRHPCTNHTDYEFRIPDTDCNCGNCQCDEGGYCCGDERVSAYCPDCGAEIERPYCYVCAGEDCGCGETIDALDDVAYSGTVWAKWINGALAEYRGSGHPHVQSGNYCLGNTAELFVGVTTKEQAIEAVVTHVSNVDFSDGLGGPNDYYGIEAI